MLSSLTSDKDEDKHKDKGKAKDKHKHRQFISYLRTPNCPYLFCKRQKLVSLSCVCNLFETKSLPFPQSKYPQPSFSTIKYMVLIFPIYKEPPSAFLCLKGWLVTTFSCWIIGPSSFFHFGFASFILNNF